MKTCPVRFYWFLKQEFLLKITYSSFLILLFLGSFAFVGNSLVLILFGRRHSTRTGIDVLTANLALSDMLMACSQFPVLVVNSFHGKWTLGPVACKVSFLMLCRYQCQFYYISWQYELALIQLTRIHFGKPFNETV